MVISSSICIALTSFAFLEMSELQSYHYQFVAVVYNKALLLLFIVPDGDMSKKRGESVFRVEGEPVSPDRGQLPAAGPVNPDNHAENDSGMNGSFMPLRMESSGTQVRHHRALVAVPSASMAKRLTFWDLFQASMKMRAARRPRTLMEIAQYVQRMLRVRPEWRHELASEIDAIDCVEVIESAFQTASMQRKARMLLHAIFALGVKLGACRGNPLDLVSYICEKEKPIRALRIEEVRRLLNAAQQKEHLACAPAVGVMLWAGLRPTEVTRLHWSDLHMEERVIHLKPQHSKTGSVRQVRIHDVLLSWLQRTAPCRSFQTKLVPRGWERRWRALRRSAGFRTWTPDVLRHTFASYHVKYFRNLSELQLEMGHSSAKMLLTRYLGMDHVTAEGAAEFWGYEKVVSGAGFTPYRKD